MTLSMIMVGQILLSVPVLLIRAKQSVISLPLALFLFANGTLVMLPIVSTYFPNGYQLYSALAFPALFVLCPSLWFYVEGITAEKPWRLNLKQARHFILLWPALLISIMMLLLPHDMHTAIFIDDAEVSGPYAITLMVSILTIILLWLGQCVYTIYRIIRRLITFRQQLKNVFSNNDDKELNWINWLMFVVISAWLFSLATLFSSSLFDNLLFNLRTESLLSLLLIWSLAHFGLQQKPIFTEYYEQCHDEHCNDETNANLALEESSESKCNKSKNHVSDNEDKTENEHKGKSDNKSASEPAKKYQRSALSKEQATRIADKINNVMKNDKLYLDASLSLQKLASHVAISPNYISQTLNETLSANFFDFVNQWRIEAAKPKIIANKNTVLDIALEVGFNARSSFYKAFKQETGQTPSEYRKQFKG
jgi:AraC-like DNA-binding protein